MDDKDLKMHRLNSLENIRLNLAAFLHCGAIYRKSEVAGIFELDLIQWDYNQQYWSPLIYRGCILKFTNYALVIDEDLEFDSETEKDKYIQNGAYPSDIIGIDVYNEGNVFKFDFIGSIYQVYLKTRELPFIQVQKFFPSITLDAFMENVVRIGESNE